MIYDAVQKLIDYALKNELITADDIYVIRNQLMEALKLNNWVDTAADCKDESIDEILEPLIAYACENGIISDTANSRDLFDTKLTGILTPMPTEATEMFHILKNAENPHFYGFRLHTFRTTDKVVRYGINNQFDFAEHPAVIQRGEKRTINICVAVPDVA